MRSAVAALLAVALFSGCLVRAAEMQPDPEKVARAVQRGVAYLKFEQKDDGSWRELSTYPGGVTALCTLALLQAGTATDDDSIRRALDHLRALGEPRSTYVTALQTMVFCAVDPQKDMALIERNVRWIESKQLKSGKNHQHKGAWNYGAGGGRGDGSNSHFALLALHAATEAGVKVQSDTWRLALDYWADSQEEDGSWCYTPGLLISSTGSMTCAGITSADIAAKHLDEEAASTRARAAKNKAFAWLAQHFSVTQNPGPPELDRRWVFFYLHALNHAGQLTGRQRIGDHDWHREGTEFLVARQDLIDGRWMGVGYPENNPLITTSLALLFLTSKAPAGP